MDLALALAGDGLGALSRDPARTLAEGLDRAVVVLDPERRLVDGNARGRAALAGEATGTCHGAFRGLPGTCPDCPLATREPVTAAGVCCAPVSRADGPPGGVVCVAAGKDAFCIEGRLADILERSLAAVFVADRDLRLCYVNAAYARLYACPREALLGMSLADLVPPDKLARFQETVRRVVERRQAVEREGTLCLDGRERTFFIEFIPLLDKAGEFEALCGMLSEITARRLAERELSESRQRYLAMVEDQTELVARLSRDLRLVFVNRALARLMGQTTESLLGGQFGDHEPEAEAEYNRQLLAALTTRSPVCDIRQRLMLPGNEERCLSWTVRAIFDESGRLVEYQGTGRDITAYWRMERELIRSEAKYRDIFEHSAEGIFQFDPEGGMAACNPALARILGYASVEDVLLEQGDLFSRIQARQEDRLEFLRLLAKNGRIYEYEMPVVRPDGRVVWLSVNARAVLDEDGRLTRVEGAARDITDRKRAEEERMLLVSAVDQSAEGLVIVGRDFRLEYANPAFAQIVGPVTGEAMEDRLVPFLTASVRKMLGLGLRWSGRVRLTLPDGGEGVAEALISPVRDTGGRIVNHIMLVRDMTYETVLEKRLRQAEKLEAIGVLAGGVAHDFNNILTPILLNTEMILADIPWKDPLRRPLADVVRASERARDLVRQLLTFSRQGELTVGPLPLTPLVKETIKLARGMVDGRVEIRQKVSELELAVEADPAQMHQVLMNLCLNAAQAMPEGGRMEVGLTAVPEPPRPEGPVIAAGLPLAKMAEGPYARLWVADRGHGMAPDICERIFEPFFTTKKPGQGTGMGLAAVHGIVKSCGGAVLVESAPGKGSRFDVYLPLLQKPIREDAD
jgi:PAS domain S-box-containing protein